MLLSKQIVLNGSIVVIRRPDRFERWPNTASEMDLTEPRVTSTSWQIP